ncbi:MAG: hypothetical protein PHH54_00755 [Candidatus Nanoarchaeia archaeon]|nr:hypothetical protein [Candidatus Nanoarchaeia archaeon]MDD5740492.1 hypothetical protein [Candidatus Nanoarchaeia archaeon]
MAKRLETLNFDNPTAEETERHQRMAENIEFEQKCEDYLNGERIRKYTDFLKAVKQSGINVENILSDIPAKMRHLRDIMGYEVLIGKNNKPVPLDDAKSSRIGKAYLHTYNQARRYLDNSNN